MAKLQLVFELDKDWHIENGYTIEEFEQLENDLENTDASFHADDFWIKGFKLERVRYSKQPREVIL